MILNAGIPQSRCLADQTKLIIMSESNKKRVQGTSLCPPQFLVLKWSHITSAHQRLFILNPLIKDSNQDAKFTNALRFHCLSGTVYLSEGKGNRNLNRNRNGDRSGCCEGVEWNGMSPAGATLRAVQKPCRNYAAKGPRNRSGTKARKPRGIKGYPCVMRDGDLFMSISACELEWGGG